MIEGVNQLNGYKKNKQSMISENKYVAFNVFGTIILSFLILFISSLIGVTYTKTEYIISFLIILIPINEIIIALTNYTVNKVVDIKLVPKLNVSERNS